MILKRLICLAFLSFNVVAIFGQTGKVTGKVIDKETGETLIGATVAIKGTTKGTITDFDGNFSLEVESGTHDVEVSYVSYEKQVFEGVIVSTGDVVTLNVNLGTATTELAEVVITGRSRQRTEAALQVMQKKSATVLDGISAQQMSKLGDSDAAAALKRVTGVSVQSGKYIFVRGLGERYTKITLNNAEIPGLDPEKNTVQMDIFPSNVIENIIVQKTFSPDMPGESTGGRVDIVTRDFPESFTLYFSSKFGYNPQVNLRDDFLNYEGGDLDFLGIDDGTRDIPERAQTAIDEILSENQSTIGIAGPQTDQDLIQITESFNERFETIPTSSFLNQSYKFALGNQFNFMGKPLGYNFSYNYSNKYGFFENGRFAVSDGDDPYGKMDVSDNLGDHSVKNTGLLNLNYKLNNFNKVGIRYIGSMTGKSVGRYREGAYRYESLGTNIQRRNLGYIQRNFHSLQLHGKHITNNKMEISWLSSYTNMIQDEPDLRFFVNLYSISPTGEKSNYQVRPNEPPVRFYRDMSEINYDNKIDISIPFAKPFKGKLQFGGVYLFKFRDLALNTFRIRNTHTVDFSLYNNNLEGYLQQTYDPGTGEGIVYTLDHTDDLINSFKSEQEMYAGYGMIDMVLTNKLRVITGARIEYSDVLTENKSPISRKKKEGGYEATDILPSLNMTYELINDFNIRFAYSKTLARPLFNENSPINYYDYQKGMIINGNEELVRTKIDNIDLRFEYFFKPGELFAVSGFYKYFDNPIEIRFDTASNNPQVKFINTDEAFLYGLETELRKKLDFIHFLRDFELGTNFTYVFSEVEIPEAEYREIRQIDPDANNTRPLSGQAPYIFNAYLNYENRNLNFSTSLAFNITGDKIIILNKSITPDIYEEGRPALNFNMAKGIGNRFSLELSVDNILDSKYHAYYNFDDPATYYQHTRGRTYSISVKYLID